jgi:signal transduction histidine kinase
VTLAAYRVVQEGLINALRHSQATQVDINVHADGERMIVTIIDDGVGLPEQWALPGHFGLRGLTERITHLGGVLKVANRESRGVCLSAEIPLAGSI